MVYLHSGLFYLHILFGSAALLLFWIPAFMKKGSLDHVKFGRYYANTMYTVAVSGALMAMIVLYDPIQIFANRISANDNVTELTDKLRVMYWLLLFFSLLTFTSVRHSILVLKCKTNRRALRQPAHIVLTAGLLVFAIVILSLGVSRNQTLHMIFGTLGIFISSGMLHYSFRPQIKPNQWWIEHLGAIIGSGIGAYTAFFAFGGRHLLETVGSWQLLFWIAPGVIGSLFIARLSRQYAVKFKH